MNTEKETLTAPAEAKAPRPRKSGSRFGPTLVQIQKRTRRAARGAVTAQAVVEHLNNEAKTRTLTKPEQHRLYLAQLLSAQCRLVFGRAFEYCVRHNIRCESNPNPVPHRDARLRKFHANKDLSLAA